MAVAAIKEGAYDFLTKPFSVDTLLLAVNQGLERRMLSREAKKAARAEREAQKLAEEKARLEELDQAKKQFIRLVTHELQAPIAAVENYLQLILEGYVPPEKQREVICKCIARAEEERVLINDLLELSHLESEINHLDELVNVPDILLEVLDDCREIIKEKNLNLVKKINGNIPQIQVDPGQIKSLWCNLVSNAVKYTQPGGDIEMTLNTDESWLIGMVRDTGIGIPGEEQDRLFSEFFRAQNAKKAGIPGTGLGLVIVKRIVERLGGEVSLESQPGEGTLVCFRIPITKKA
jgi:signal transduction histidine kinase